MSEMTFPQPRREDYELAAANRKLTTAILGMTLLTGLIACMAYLAGRTVTRMQDGPVVVQAAELPPAPVIVEPLNAGNRPSQRGANPAAEPISCPAAAGDLYFQVGLMNLALTQDWVNGLKTKGYPLKMAPVEGSPNHRVLVGPLKDQAQEEALAARLTADGYEYFRRRW